MKVAFHLRRRSRPDALMAVLVETDRVEVLVDLASRLTAKRLPPVFRVSGGFLLKLGSGVEPPTGSIRLRALAENLYLPADADLIPALLDDEASGLTRDRGLVFLPGGRILGFDPDDPLPIASLVTADRREGSRWRPFPARPERPDRLREVTLETVEGAGDDVFDADGASSEIGSEGPPRPEDAGAASTLAGRAAVGAGKGLIGLGAMLGIKALADLGAKWINRAVDRVPRLTEAILGQQEGALRELLRQFREGEVDRALRHALPLGGSGGRGGVASSEGKLPNVDPTYSLQSLLGSDRGPTGFWFGGFDVQSELVKEYRKAAEEAERRGDYRRAAYILGKLLNDFLTAARMLSRAGLHRDAAFVYLNRLRDIGLAARSFEAAGEIDRALELYRHYQLHAEAGDLLRRMGEEEAAVAEYAWAAEKLAADAHQGPMAAGDLLRDRARRGDLALVHYTKGWDRRPSGNAVACALRMASLYADEAQVQPLLRLVNEADELLREPRTEQAAVEFYNELARLADREGLREAREELRDRCLMGLAAKLRDQVTSPRRLGMLASNYFGKNKVWSPDLVADATHAMKAAIELEAERRRLSKMILGPTARGDARRIEVEGGVVSAACHASSTGEVFLGFEGGRIFRFNVASGVVSCLADVEAPISSMAVDPEGRTLVLLVGDGSGPRALVHLERASHAATGWTRQGRVVDGPGDFWLTPVMGDGSNRAVGVWNGESMVLFGGEGDLSLWMRLQMPFLKTAPAAALLVPPADGKAPSPRAVLVHDGPDICQVESMGKMVRRRYLGWRPTLPEGHTLRSAVLSWIQAEPERFELVGLDREGVVHWSSLKVNDADLIRLSNNVSTGEAIYSAATLIRAGLVAGVTQGRVDWFRCGPQNLTLVGSSELSAQAPLACFPAHGIEELVVVCRAGTLICLPTPR